MYNHHEMLWWCLYWIQKDMQTGDHTKAMNTIAEVADILGETYVTTRERYRVYIGYL